MLQVEPAAPHPRPVGWPSIGKLLLVAVVWGGAGFLVLGNAAVTRIGPVLYSISGGHGVHAGDIIVGTVVFCLAVLATAVIVWPRGR